MVENIFGRMNCMNQNSEGIIFYSDMSICQPQNALTRTVKKGCWRLVDYETENGVKGTMAFAAPEDDACEITLHLNASGIYRIYLGINYTRAALGDILQKSEFSAYGQLWARLSDDKGFSRFAIETPGRHAEKFKNKVGKEKQIWTSIHETYWKTADVTNQSIIISTPKEPYNGCDLRQIANISYVKLEPLDEKEIKQWRQWEKDSSTQETRRVAMFWCSGMLTGHTAGNTMYHPIDMQWFRDEFEPFIDSDIGIFAFEAIRGNLCAFKTKIGDVGTEDNNWDEKWIDPLKAFTEIAHENKMKIFAGVRLIGAGFPVVRNPINWARFYWNHQEWAKKDKDGVACSNVSIAFPEVRNHYLGMIKEALEYGIDGIQMHLNRCFPFVLYEEPVVSSFIDKFGQHPAQIREDDIRWIKHCAGFVTQFLREIRIVLDEKPGRQLAVTYWPFKYDKEKGCDVIFNQCDVAEWIKEGLIDYLMPTYDVHPELIKYWKELGNGKTQVWPDLMPRTQPGEDFAALAKKYYEAGADGLALWDGERRAPRASEWAVLRRLGHKDMTDYFIRNAPKYFTVNPLKYLNGMSVACSFTDG
jgi:hypothetical protein